jgi:hypothetical protein
MPVTVNTQIKKKTQKVQQIMKHGQNLFNEINKYEGITSAQICHTIPRLPKPRQSVTTTLLTSMVA